MVKYFINLILFVNSILCMIYWFMVDWIERVLLLARVLENLGLDSIVVDVVDVGSYVWC